MGGRIDLDSARLEKMLEWLLAFEKSPETAYAYCACAAVALARDIGNLDRNQFLDNIGGAWDATPEGLLSPLEPDSSKRKFDS